MSTRYRIISRPHLDDIFSMLEVFVVQERRWFRWRNLAVSNSFAGASGWLQAHCPYLVLNPVPRKEKVLQEFYAHNGGTTNPGP